MGSVYLVFDQQLEAQWALKELDIGIVLEAEKDSALELFRRESELQATLSHPGLPRVVDFFLDESGSRCLVMEFIPGRPLDEVLETIGRPLLLQEAIPILLQVTHVLEYLHRCDPPVVFRDLKPSNLMLTPEGKVTLIDFGIARHYDKDRKKDTQELGTPGFCAPEQYGHGQSTPRSDIYAVGTTLFHLVTRDDPQSFHFKFPKLSSRMSVPAGLDECLESVLKLNPGERPESVVKVRQQLEAVLVALDPLAPVATRTLFPGLLQLLRHANLVRSEQDKSPWQFWKNWLSEVF